LFLPYKYDTIKNKCCKGMAWLLLTTTDEYRFTCFEGWDFFRYRIL
jgi:hypothetical protein